jgi:predicted DNA-binding transcriptional regulator AlpA
MPRTTSPQRQPALDGELMTPEQVSELTGVATGTLKYWRHVNKGPASFKLGTRVLYRRTAVMAWIAVCEMETRRGGVE